jgi:hypothetical protein
LVAIVNSDFWNICQTTRVKGKVARLTAISDTLFFSTVFASITFIFNPSPNLKFMRMHRIEKLGWGVDHTFRGMEMVITMLAFIREANAMAVAPVTTILTIGIDFFDEI